MPLHKCIEFRIIAMVCSNFILLHYYISYMQS